MDRISICLIVALVAIKVLTANSEETANSTKVNSRGARKDYTVYSPPDPYASKIQQFTPSNAYKSDDDDDDMLSIYEPEIEERKDTVTSPKSPPLYSPPAFEEYTPIGYYTAPRPPRYNGPKGNMYKSGSSVKWNVWKGAGDSDSAADNTKGPPPDYYYPMATGWKGDYSPDQMMAMMNMMNQMQESKKGGISGFFSRLTRDPVALFIAAIIPISLLLAAVLPTLINMMMNGGLPTVMTTATGNTGRNLDNAEFLAPVLEAITTFGFKTFDSPECMQRVFCQVTRGKPSNSTEFRSFQKALYKASTLIDSQLLESFGVRKLFDALQDGKCDKIPCEPPVKSWRMKGKGTKTP